MKKYIMLVAILAVFTASPVVAEELGNQTLNLTTLPGTTGGGYYVGAVGGWVTGSTNTNFFCDDFATTTRVPSTFQVLVSSLSDISGTKFHNQQNALTKYQQVGWLMNQMEINPVQNIAAIQFAMWSVFTPTPYTLGFAGAAYWLTASASINASSYDFSQMRIYTPIGSSNQEFIGGQVSAVPEPGEWMLLIIGLGLITYSVYRNRAKGVVFIRT